MPFAKSNSLISARRDRGGTHLCLGLRDVVPANLDPRLEEGLREVVDVDAEEMRDLKIEGIE